MDKVSFTGLFSLVFSDGGDSTEMTLKLGGKKAVTVSELPDAIAQSVKARLESLRGESAALKNLQKLNDEASKMASAAVKRAEKAEAEVAAYRAKSARVSGSRSSNKR